MISKHELYDFLNELKISHLVKDLYFFEKTLNLNLSLDSPTLHKKEEIKFLIHDQFYKKYGNKLEIKINIINNKFNEKSKKGMDIDGVKNIIAISSTKGGVGKSTISTNIALILHQMGFKVGILDTDIYGPSIPIMFDVENYKPSSINIKGENKINPIESYGVKLLSIGFFISVSQAVVWRGPMATKAITQMIRDAYWGDLDFLILDLPPGTGDIHLSITQELPVTGSVVVTTPQNIALSDVKKGIIMFQLQSINIPILGIIENMAYFIPKDLPEKKYYLFGNEGYIKQYVKNIKLPFLGTIPFYEDICKGSDIGFPSVLQDKSIAKKIFQEITQNIINQLLKRNNDLPKTKAVKITHKKGCNQ